MTYLERLDAIPPPVCRLIALERYRGKLRRPKRPYRMLKITEIAQIGGLSWQRAAWIARQKTFARVPVEEAEKFRLGCGIRVDNESARRQFVRRLFQDKDELAELFDRPPDGRPRSSRKVLKRL